MEARQIQKYDLIALPVVGGDDTLLGIITHDDAIDIITQEQTEDVEKLMAIAGSHETGSYLRDSAWIHFKNRVGWVVALAAVGLACGYIVQSLPEGATLTRAALAIAIALGLQVISATVVGAMVPLAASKLKPDPALVASPALTTAVDVTGLLLFFSIASRMLEI